jgi:transposase-like protein
MATVLNIISNGHKNFKNNPNNVKPSRGVILCVIVARKNLNLENYKHHKKSFTKRAIIFDISCLLGQMTNVMARIAA